MDSHDTSTRNNLHLDTLYKQIPYNSVAFWVSCDPNAQFGDRFVSWFC